MGASDRHEGHPSPEGRGQARAVAAAAAAAVAVACIYHMPGGTVADDALRAALAGAACTAALAWSRRAGGRPGGGAGRGGRAPAAIAALLAMLACALSCCAADAAASAGARGQAWAFPGAAPIAVLAASCLGTAAWEEALFRELLPLAFMGQLRPGRGRLLACACVCSGLFGLLHIGDLEWPLAGARLAQTALFGMGMAGVAARTGRLRWAVASHWAFDFACFGYSLARAAGAGAAPGLAMLGLPAESLLGPAASGAGIAASLPVLAALAAWAGRELWRQGSGEKGR